MRAEAKAVIAGLGVLLILILWMIVAERLPNYSETVTQEFKFEDLRFQEVETFVFERWSHGTSTAVIYEDTKTRVQYLYIMSSAPNGGPCITRLWEK